MRELKASTKAGQNILERARRCEGFTLDDVYTRCSPAKEKAYRDCWEMFLNTEKSAGFRICSFNTFGFTCSWRGEQDGERIMRYETKDNSYLIWLER